MTNLRNLTVQMLIGLALVALIGGCSASDASAPAESPPTEAASGTTVPESTLATAPTLAPGPTADSAVTITGQVSQVAAGARVINLSQTVEGFNRVALTDQTEFISKDNSVKSLADLKPGMTIEATGKSGGSSALLASQIRILAVPAPATESGQWKRVPLPDLKLSMEVPNGWKQQGQAFAWANPNAGAQRVGINWKVREGGVEPTSILPPHATNLDAAPLELKWGQAIKHTVEIAASGGGSTVAIETHVIVLTEKFIVDVYASAPSPEELDTLWLTVQHMLDSAR